MSAFTLAEEETLAELIDAVAPAAVVLIGAAAVDLHMPMHWRRTHDLDLVVAIELDAFRALDSRLVGWSHDPRREHAWRSPHGVDVDLVPAGPLLRARGEVVFPRSGNVMDLSAIDLAFVHAVPFPLGVSSVSVAPIEVLSLLKMVSWLDSPHRQHDLADLAHILDAWLPIDDERRYDDEVLADQVPYDDVPALLLGRAIATVARAPHLDVVRRFLIRVGDEANSAHGLMLKHGPVAWRNDEDRLVRRLAALRRGIGL